jgi:hypothetical protein
MDVNLPSSYTSTSSSPQPPRRTHLKQLSLATTSVVGAGRSLHSSSSASSPRYQPSTNSSSSSAAPTTTSFPSITSPSPAPSSLTRSGSSSSSLAGAHAGPPRTPTSRPTPTHRPSLSGTPRRTSSISYAPSPARGSSFDSAASNPYALSRSQGPSTPSSLPSSVGVRRTGSSDTGGGREGALGLGLAGLDEEDGPGRAAESMTKLDGRTGSIEGMGSVLRTPVRASSLSRPQGRDSPSLEGRDPESFLTLAEKYEPSLSSQ